MYSEDRAEVSTERLTSRQLNQINQIISIIIDKIDPILCPSSPSGEKRMPSETIQSGALEEIIDRLTDIQDRIRL
jgi:hypothetical protein